jgi:hypothetical protein
VQLKIYLSSTFEDLKDYREKVYRELRSLRHDVIAMEDYVAADVRPVDKCLVDVRTSDIYVGLFAWRYGYVPVKDNPERKSITELEFREAEKLGKPCLLFILRDEALWSPSMMDARTGENERGDRIAALRRLLREERLASAFESADELASKVVAALYRWQMDSSAPGAAAVPAPRGPRPGRARPREGYTSLWENGSRLRVRFIGGAPSLRSRIMRVARIWSAYANVLLEPSDDHDAELRISFKKESGDWSYVGAEALAISNDDPTVNFDWLGPETAIDELEGVVLREFGHVLGLQQEHRNPDAAIPWNKTAIYRDLGATQGWTKDQIDHNLFQVWSRDQYPSTKPFDPNSIMTFNFLKEWTGGLLANRNMMLSSGDKEFIGRLYPYE